MKTVFVTGTAGFIGFHLTGQLCRAGYRVVGLDNLNAYYTPQLKRDRLQALAKTYGDLCLTIEGDLADHALVDRVFADHAPAIVVHLAAQAGVRYSIDNPHVYIDSNITGTLNILEGCRHHPVRHLIFASSSSVYGSNTKTPFAVTDRVDHPISLYAATKKANELMAHTYAHLYGVPSTGLRFFTVYGPWGRPDMAVYKFTDKIIRGEAIELYNQGDMKRDFTYIDDIVKGILNMLEHPPEPNPSYVGYGDDPSASHAPYRLYNIGNNNPVDLMHLVTTLEEAIGIKAHKTFLPMQPGDVYTTYADVDALVRDFNFRPTTPIETGIGHFVRWYRDYHNLGNGPVARAV